jgi:hypothetical protein
LLPATSGGGLIGLLLGFIGGPFSVLIGGATGLMVGSLLDLADMDETDWELGAIFSAVKVGRTELLAVVLEQRPKWSMPPCLESPAPLLRRPVAEVAAAEGAERKAKREAPKELFRARHEHDTAEPSRQRSASVAQQRLQAG